MSTAEAMRQAGYSPVTADTPERLTKSKGWAELLEKMLPDTLLGERHLELLNKREVKPAQRTEDGQVIYEMTDQPDTQAVKAALDMAYKLKRRYPKEEGSIDPQSLVLNVLAFVQNGTPTIVSEATEGPSGADGGIDKALRSPLAIDRERNVLDQE